MRTLTGRLCGAVLHDVGVGDGVDFVPPITGAGGLTILATVLLGGLDDISHLHKNIVNI